MDKLIYIGGFGGSHRLARYVADGIREFYNLGKVDVEQFAFAEAMEMGAAIDYVTRDAAVFTHSAGMLAIRHAWPESLVAVAPPFPVKAPLLVMRSGTKTVRMTSGALRDRKRMNEVWRVNGAHLRELAARPFGNLKHLPAISRFDACRVAGALHRRMADRVTIACMRDDAFGFRPRHEFPGLYFVNGEHDELLVSPGAVLSQLPSLAV